VTAVHHTRKAMGMSTVLSQIHAITELFFIGLYTEYTYNTGWFGVCENSTGHQS